MSKNTKRTIITTGERFFYWGISLGFGLRNVQPKSNYRTSFWLITLVVPFYVWNFELSYHYK